MPHTHTHTHTYKMRTEIHYHIHSISQKHIKNYISQKKKRVSTFIMCTHNKITHTKHTTTTIAIDIIRVTYIKNKITKKKTLSNHS